MKRMLDSMTAVHSARRPYGPRSDWFPTQRAMDIRRSNSAQAEASRYPHASQTRAQGVIRQQYFHDPL